MDPLSHALCGLTIVSVRPTSGTSTVTRVAAAVGALSPDIDLPVALAGWDRYLLVHQAGTHSLAGALACAVLVAAAGRRLSATPFQTLLAAAAAGAVSHLALDLVSGATLRLLWPVAPRAWSLPLVAMADPWLAGILVLGVLAAWPRPRRRRMAALTIAVMLVFLAAKTVLLSSARGIWEHVTARDTIEASLPEAEWGSLTRWLVNDRTHDHVRQWIVDVRRGRAELLLDRPSWIDPRALQLPTVQNLVRAHDFTFAVVSGVADRQQLAASDVRYCWNPDLSPPAVSSGTLLRPTADPVACGLWFGGAVDASGTPADAFVSIGSYRQAR